MFLHLFPKSWQCFICHLFRQQANGRDTLRVVSSRHKTEKAKQKSKSVLEGNRQMETDIKWGGGVQGKKTALRCVQNNEI